MMDFIFNSGEDMMEYIEQFGWSFDCYIATYNQETKKWHLALG